MCHLNNIHWASVVSQTEEKRKEGAQHTGKLKPAAPSMTVAGGERPKVFWQKYIVAAKLEKYENCAQKGC